MRCRGFCGESWTTFCARTQKRTPAKSGWQGAGEKSLALCFSGRRKPITARKANPQKPWSAIRRQYPHCWPRLKIARELRLSPAYLRKLERLGEFPPPDVITARLKLWNIDKVKRWAGARVLPEARHGTARLTAKAAIGELMPRAWDDRPHDLVWWKRWNLECGTRLTAVDAARISRKVQDRV